PILRIPIRVNDCLGTIEVARGPKPLAIAGVAGLTLPTLACAIATFLFTGRRGLSPMLPRICGLFLYIPALPFPLPDPAFGVGGPVSVAGVGFPLPGLPGQGFGGGPAPGGGVGHSLPLQGPFGGGPAPGGGGGHALPLQGPFGGGPTPGGGGG